MKSVLSDAAIGRVTSDPYLKKTYTGRNVLILGADGFLGSYLTLALKTLGANVSVVTRRERPLMDRLGVSVFKGDLCSSSVVEQALQGQEIVFDMAGASGGIDSNRNAAENLSIESAPHLKLFEASSRLPEPPLIVFCSSRTVYGKPTVLPVSESHPTQPVSIYAVHKLTLERYLQLFHSLHGLRYVVFRLSNPYGPFPWQEGKSYGVLNQFIAKALKGETLTLFGDGSQLRDYIFIEDVIDVFLRSAIEKDAEQKVFNLGGPNGISMMDAVSQIVDAAPGSSIATRDWPSDYKAIETGDYVSDTGLLGKVLGWQPKVSFTEGLERTINSYQAGEAQVSLGNNTREFENDLDFWSGRRVLVTGAGGSLGTFLCGTLAKLGAKVDALYRSKFSERLRNDPAIKAHQLDLSAEGSELETIFEASNPEVVFHLASTPDGQEGSEKILERIQSNTVGTTRLLESARKCGTECFLIADSCKVYGNAPVPHHEGSDINPESSYAATKYSAWVIAEIFHRNYGVAVASLRPTLIYGPGQAFNLFTFLSNCVKDGRKKIELSGGKQTRDPIFITDAVRAYLEAAQNIKSVAGRAIPIGGGQEFSVLDLSRRFVSLRAKEVEVEACSASIRPGEILRSLCDNRDALSLFNWRPRIALQTGLSYLADFLFTEQAEQDKLLDKWEQRLVDEMRASSAEPVSR